MPEPEQMHGAGDGFGGEDTPHSPAVDLCRQVAPLHLGNMDRKTEARLLAIGARLPGLRWWFSVHASLGCSPRDAADAGRLDEVEALLDALPQKSGAHKHKISDETLVSMLKNVTDISVAPGIEVEIHTTPTHSIFPTERRITLVISHAASKT